MGAVQPACVVDRNKSVGGGYAPIAYDVIGYVQKWALRTPFEEQTCIYNVGADGSFGIRTVIYRRRGYSGMGKSVM